MGFLVTRTSIPAVTPPSVGNSGIVFQFINGGQTTAPTTSFDTTTGFLFAAVGRGAITDFATNTVTDNKGNTLAITGTTHNYSPQWPNSGTACYFKANATGGTGCIVSDNKPDDNDEVTVVAINILNATQIESSSFVYRTTGPTNAATDITVTKNSVLIAVWSGNDANGEQGPSFGAGWTRQQTTNSTAGNHVQMAIATRVVTPGTYGYTVTPQTSQGGQCYLFGVN